MKLKETIRYSRDNYLSLIKIPFEDLPQNSSLTNLPSYSEFLSENRQLLEKAKEYFKKSLSLIENSILFVERSFSIEDIAW